MIAYDGNYVGQIVVRNKDVALIEHLRAHGLTLPYNADQTQQTRVSDLSRFRPAPLVVLSSSGTVTLEI